MSFKKYTNEELLMLASIASMTEEEAESISMEKGDVSFVTMEEYISPSYLNKPNAVRHAIRRKETFKKKAERKELAQKLGYNVGTEYNNKKVKDLLSANHSDNAYFRGNKSDKKYMSAQEEKALMVQESWELARDAMEEYHNSILGSIGQDIDTLTLDAESIEYRIEDLEAEYNELEEAMKLVSEKLENAKLRKNGIVAALLQKEYEYRKTSDKLMQEAHRFGW